MNQKCAVETLAVLQINSYNKLMKPNLLLKKELNRILLFATDIVACQDAFITLKEQGIHQIFCKVGLEQFKSASKFDLFEKILLQESNLILSKSNHLEINFQGNSEYDFDFMAGFPIRISKNKEVIASICFFGCSIKLTDLQLKLLESIPIQIASLLQLYIENEKLKSIVVHKNKELGLFATAIKEELFHLDLNGIITYLSKKCISVLGNDYINRVGKHFNSIVHPNDLELCTLFLESALKSPHINHEHTYRIKTKDNIYIWYTASIKVVEENNSIAFIGTYRKTIKYADNQNKLQEQKEFYEKILNQLPTGIAVYNHEFRYMYLNPAAIKDEELRKLAIGKTNFEYEEISDRDLSFAENRQLKFDEAIFNKKTIEWDDQILNKSTGLMSYHNRKLTPVFFQNGTLDMLIGIGIDNTESKLIHEEMVKIKMLTTSIIQNVAVGILVQGPDAEIIENNNAACEMLGLTQDQLLGKTSFDKHWSVIHLDGTTFNSEDHPVPQAIKHLKPINNVVMGVYRPVTNDFVWLLVDAIPVFDSEEKLLYVVCSFNDITLQKKTEKDLKISNERFTHSSTATSDVIWDWDLATGQIFVGDSTTGHFGYELVNNTLQGEEVFNYLHSDDIINLRNNLKSIIKSAELRWQDACRVRKFDGTYAAVKLQAVIIRDEKGRTNRMIGAMRDITNEQNLQNELQQSEKQFKDAFNNSGAGMAIVDLNRYMEVVNNQISNILGYSSEELKKMTFDDLLFEKDKLDDAESLEFLLNGKLSNYSKEKRYKHKNGSVVWGLTSVSLIKNVLNEPLHFIKQIIDITHKKQVEKSNKLLLQENIKNKALQLNDLKSMYRLLAENTVDLVCSHNLDGTLQYISPSIKQIFGYKVTYLIGLNMEHIVHPEDVEILRKCMERILEGKEDYPAKIRFRKKDNNYIWCEVKGRLISENGIPVSFHTSTRDITQTRKAEFAIDKTLKRERELNELRTNLVSTVSHEFRTPMTTIRSSAELIAIYLENQIINNKHLVQKRVTTIIGEIDRIVALMNTVLIIAKDDVGKTTFQPAVFDLKQTCIDVIEICEFEQKDGRKVEVVFEGDPLTIFADKNLIEYILFNVLNNAFKYSYNSGQNVTLKISRNKEFIFVEIIDFGIGIPKEDQYKLFNTFFRASNSSGIQGTGLGLYIVKTFTERNGGTIKLKSKEGKGTKVLLQFPVVLE